MDVRLVDCPRDAIQGLERFIPTERKATYINCLIESKLFEYIDFGSFVSHKAVPQMKDTASVLQRVNKINNTKLLTIVANKKGAEEAVSHAKIDYIGYPFSISEQFQLRNINNTVDNAYEDVKFIQDIATSKNKRLVVYISMAFGNPYGEPWSEDLVISWIEKIKNLGVVNFSLADTTSEAQELQITGLFQKVINSFPSLAISAHFHSLPEDSLKKIQAAYSGGCRRFEGAVLGYGGCPFAQNDLVGNIPTETLLRHFFQTEEHEIFSLQESFLNLIQT